MNQKYHWGKSMKQLACLGLLIPGMASAEPTADVEFKLSQKSAFELGQDDFIRGQMVACRTQAFTEVKSYPVFKSNKPLYALAKFAGEYGNMNSGISYYFAIDESKGPDKGYDHLYFDLNQDLNLANDSPIAVQKAPQLEAVLKGSYYKKQVCFDHISVKFDYGAEGMKSLVLLPRLIQYEGDGAGVCFVNTKVWTGDIQIAGVRCSVQLGNDYFISGRYDHPGTALRISASGVSGSFGEWWGGDRLMAIHKIKGQFYRFSASPSGDRLFVHPYRGAMGTFEVGAGGRKLDKMEVKGSFQAVDKAVPVGGEHDQHGWLSAVQKCSVPVGEYLPTYLTLTYGHLQITLSQNYHSEGKPRDRGDHPLVFGIKIAKDKPFVFDFSNKPEVMFALPTKNQRIKPGDKVEVKAVLTDPKLDIMIRGINNPSIKVAQETTLSDGTKRKFERSKSLDPTVQILRMNGDKVAEGIMPFG